MEHFLEFFPAICAGFGLFLAGAVNLLLVRRGFTVRTIATVLALGIAITAAWSLNQPGATVGTVRLLAIGMIPFLLLSSRAIGEWTVSLVASAHRPVVRYVLLTVAGLGTALASIIICERADDAA